MDEDYYEASPELAGLREHQRRKADGLSSPASTTSLSDKENLSQHSKHDSRNSLSNPPPGIATTLTLQSSAKRKRMEDRDSNSQGSRRRTSKDAQTSLARQLDSQLFDPDQSIEERREIRKGLRELTRDLNDNRSEYLNPSSDGLLRTLIKANKISESVKQTADATIESRLLLTTADLSYRKSVQLTLGTSAQGLDVDEFVSKCITYMKAERLTAHDASNLRAGTQRHRKVDFSEEEDVGDEGDMLDWERLGRLACIQHNCRPAVSGHLLGPLSLEKRARKASHRKAPLRLSNLQQTQPEVLKAGDIERSENSNLTVLCSKILSRLKEAQRTAQRAVEAEAEANEDMTEIEMRLLMDKYGIHENGAIDLFKFVINPRSFGQSVENMFYVSFLIRDGKAGIQINESGIPSLEPTQPRKRGDPSQQGHSRHQAVLALDHATWKDLIDVFDIDEPMIPHRADEDHTQIGVRGWYG